MIFTTISRGAYMLKVIKIILQLISKQVDIWKVQEKQGSARAIKRVVQWVKLSITRVGSLTGGKGSFCDSASIFFSQFWWIITKIVIVITDISGNVTGAFYFASILFQSFWLKNIYFCCLQVPFQALRVVNPFFFFFFFGFFSDLERSFYYLDVNLSSFSFLQWRGFKTVICGATKAWGHLQLKACSYLPVGLMILIWTMTDCALFTIFEKNL